MSRERPGYGAYATTPSVDDQGRDFDRDHGRRQVAGPCVRGSISGALGKKMGLKVESARREDGVRVYQLA
jgi:hypothetical protein